METIDVKDLPEPIARGLEVVAQMARTLSGKTIEGHPKEKITLHPVKGGRVLTPLTREEIYVDDEDRASATRY